MGRYAFFNTGLEYKFGFAIQPSSDMQQFGGTCTSEEEDEAKHEWIQEDRDEVKAELDFLCESLPPFDDYEKNLEGTHALDYYIYENILKGELYKIRLGCLIYHQFLYTDKLTVGYEL